VEEALRSGVRVFVAAGGDGTVHALADALVRLSRGRPLEELFLGAVGLGSSNDFHKPAALRRGIPLRLETEGASPRDLGRVCWTRPDGSTGETVLVVSASTGAVAEGNALFNRTAAGSGFTGASIALAALRAIASHRSRPMRLEMEGLREEVSLSSLSVLETPWLSGCLRFDVPAAPDDGLLRVALYEGMGRLRLLWALGALARGHFRGRAGTRTYSVPALSLASESPFLLEVDGEVETARSATFDLYPGRLRACA
jgi:diacylglycerol kinase family enzyme